MTVKLHIELIDPLTYRKNEMQNFYWKPVDVPTIALYSIGNIEHLYESQDRPVLTWTLNDKIPAVKNAIDVIEKIQNLPYVTKIYRSVSEDFKYKTDNVDVYYSFGFENLVPNKIDYIEYCEEDFEHFSPAERKFGELVLSPLMSYEHNNESYHKSIDSAIRHNTLETYDESVHPVATPSFDLGFFLSEKTSIDEDKEINRNTVNNFIRTHKQEIEDKQFNTDLMFKRFGKIVAGHLENDPAEVFNLLKEFSYISKIWISKEE